MLASKHVQYKTIMRHSTTEALWSFGATELELLFTTNYLFNCVHMVGEKNGCLSYIDKIPSVNNLSLLFIIPLCMKAICLND